MVLLAEMVSGLVLDVCVRLVQEHLDICTSSVSGDSSLCHFDKEDSSLIDSDESLPGVLPSQPSPLYVQETQHAASRLL